MITENLTGLTRHRAQRRLFKEPLLVLEVQVHAKGYECDSHGSGQDIDHKFWRDATVSDITYLNHKDIK